MITGAVPEATAAEAAAAAVAAAATAKEGGEGEQTAPEISKTRAGGKNGLRICTNFPRFSYDFSLTVRENLKDDPTAPAQLPMSSMR